MANCGPTIHSIRKLWLKFGNSPNHHFSSTIFLLQYNICTKTWKLSDKILIHGHENDGNSYDIWIPICTNISIKFQLGHFNVRWLPKVPGKCQMSHGYAKPADMFEWLHNIHLVFVDCSIRKYLWKFDIVLLCLNASTC